jgi:hypothetical protein
MEWRRRRPTRFSKLRRMIEANPIRVPKVVSKETQVWVHLGVQDQPAVNWTLKSHKRPIATFLHGRKDNFKEPPMALIPPQNSFWVIGNYWNKWTPRIYEGVASPNCWALSSTTCGCPTLGHPQS